MKIKIVKERDNPFFKRKDLKVEVVHVGVATPKTDDLKRGLAEMYKVDESQVSVDYILTKRGIGESTARVKILNEKPVIVEKPVVEKPEEAQTEEKDEEKPAEEPAEQPAEKPMEKAVKKQKEPKEGGGAET